MAGAGIEGPVFWERKKHVGRPVVEASADPKGKTGMTELTCRGKGETEVSWRQGAAEG